jgi:nicotinamidase-related amidase
MESNRNKNTALLVMDVQGATVQILKDKTQFFTSVNKAIQTARRNSMPVIYVVVSFRKGYPEVCDNNLSFSILKNGALIFDTEEATQVDASVAPQPDDVIISKKRVSAFTGSDLEVVLRSLEIKHLVLTGISTGGVVLSTLRESADKDFRLTVLSDCCADRDDEVHRILVDKVFPRQAEVMTAEGWSLLNK